MSLDLSMINMPNTPFWPGDNLTSQHDHVCYGNLTLCANNNILCTLDNCDLTLAAFDYIPNLGGNAFFAGLFGLCLLAQVFLGFRHKTWGFMIAAVLGLLTEIIGYVGRIMINSNPFNNNAFLQYLVCLTIAPAFLSGAIYLCLSRIVVVYGENVSRIRPATYTIIFMICDFTSLLLQAAGGAIASTANDQSTTQTGINVMLAGLSFQVVSLAVFSACCIEFASRLRKNPQGWNLTHEPLYTSTLFKTFLFGLGLAVVTIFVRSVFRVAELSGGFNGPLANDEITFMILEGGMISIAALCLTIFHPGVCFQGVWAEANFKLRSGKKNVGKVSASDSSSVEEGNSRYSMRQTQTRA